MSDNFWGWFGFILIWVVFTGFVLWVTIPIQDWFDKELKQGKYSPNRKEK